MYPKERERGPGAPPRPEGDRAPGGAREGQGDRPRRPFQRPEGDRPDGGPQGAPPDRGGDRPNPQPGTGEQPRRDGEPRGEGSTRNPSDKPMAQQLRPYLGVVTTPATPAVAAQASLPEGFGLVVDEVLADSPAGVGGVERYDVLTKFDDQKLVDPNQLAALVRAAGKDATVSLTVLRKGAEKTLSVKIGEKMLPDRAMGGSRTTLPMPDFGNFRRRAEEMAGPLAERAQDMGRKAQEMTRDWQKRMKEFQEKVEQWRKNPGEKFPETPKFPNLGPTEQPGPLPPDVLREMRPGGAPAVQRKQDGATTTWSTANAHVSITDDAGSIDVRNENGKRVVTAKDPKGALIFEGPIDTEEQRRQLPETVRRKLGSMDARTRVEHREPPRDAAPPQPGGAPDVQ